jgi:hypothetical protein
MNSHSVYFCRWLYTITEASSLSDATPTTPPAEIVVAPAFPIGENPGNAPGWV